MNKSLRKDVILCFITDPEQLSSSPRDTETSSGRDFVMSQENVALPKVLSNLCLHRFFPFFKTTDVFPVAASAGRLALHGHVSTTNAPVDSGGGEGRGREGEGVRGLFYLISVSTRASV